MKAADRQRSRGASDDAGHSMRQVIDRVSGASSLHAPAAGCAWATELAPTALNRSELLGWLVRAERSGHGCKSDSAAAHRDCVRDGPMDSRAMDYDCLNCAATAGRDGCTRVVHAVAIQCSPVRPHLS